MGSSSSSSSSGLMYKVKGLEQVTHIAISIIGIAMPFDNGLLGIQFESDCGIVGALFQPYDNAPRSGVADSSL